MKLVKIILLASTFLFTERLSAQREVVNVSNADGLRIGHWVITGNMINKPDYLPDSVFEEGDYLEGKKTGVWITYHPNGKKKQELTYVNGRPSGKFSIYDNKGCLSETGVWKFAHYVDTLKKFSPEKCGELIRCSIYNKSGQCVYDSTLVENKWQVSNEAKQADSKKVISGCYVPNVSLQYNQTADDTTRFRINGQVREGYSKVYDQEKRLLLDGNFKQGKLQDGKWYHYDRNGLLVKIQIYKAGKYVGDQTDF